jgi:formylglycine-generating enzyme required for sulfatase activity
VDSGEVGDGGVPSAPVEWVLIDVSNTPFTMGSPDSPEELGRNAGEVAHGVTLTRNFLMTTTEITQQQFLDEMGYNPSSFTACGLDCPVEGVNWHELAVYTNALSRREGLDECYDCTGTARDTFHCVPSMDYATPYDCPGYRLPTEAEWEYAARGGTTTATYAGELTRELCDDTTVNPIAWYCGNAEGTTHPVGGKAPNTYGLYDMLGNVWEWCHDWYELAYSGAAEIDPAGAASGSQRVVRGGAYSGHARSARAAHRGGIEPGHQNHVNQGGRVSRSVP